MNNFKPYPKYKDSGVEWLGEVPEDWKALPTKRLFKYKKDINADRQEGNILSLTYRGVVNNSSENPEGLVPKDYATYQIFEPLDLAFKLIDLENIKTSRVGLVHERGAMSPAYIRLEPQKEISPKFAYYYFYSLYQRAIFNQLGAGVRSTLGPTDLGELIFIAPSESEQIAIANFLDEKVGKIDAAIAQKERLIELLNERKQIIIQNAVTKGLNPKAPMRDSGIEWIGEIPEHWEIEKLGTSLTPISIKNHADKPLLSITREQGVILRDVEDQESNHNFIPDDLSGYKLIRKGQFGMNKMKAWQGSYGVSEHTGIVSPAYFIFNFTRDVYPKFFHKAIRSKLYVAFFGSASDGVRIGQWDLSKSRMKQIPIILPPHAEQKSICLHINQQSSKISLAISEAEKSIEKLKEYKATLINSAVTGKIMVNRSLEETI